MALDTDHINVSRDALTSEPQYFTSYVSVSTNDFTCGFYAMATAGFTSTFSTMARYESGGTITELLFSDAPSIGSTARLQTIPASSVVAVGNPYLISFVALDQGRTTLSSNNTANRRIQLHVDVQYCTLRGQSSTMEPQAAGSLAAAVRWSDYRDPLASVVPFEEQALQLDALTLAMSPDGGCYRITGTSAAEEVASLPFVRMAVTLTFNATVAALLVDADYFPQPGSSVYMTGSASEQLRVLSTREDSRPVFTICPEKVVRVSNELVSEVNMTWAMPQALSNGVTQPLSNGNIHAPGLYKWKDIPASFTYLSGSASCTVSIKAISNAWRKQVVNQRLLSAAMLAAPSKLSDGTQLLRLASTAAPGAFEQASMTLGSVHVYQWQLNAPPGQVFELRDEVPVSLYFKAYFDLLNHSASNLALTDAFLHVNFTRAKSMYAVDRHLDASFTRWFETTGQTYITDDALSVMGTGDIPAFLHGILFEELVISLVVPLGLEGTFDDGETATLSPIVVDLHLRSAATASPIFRVVHSDQTRPTIRCPADISATTDQATSFEFNATLLEPLEMSDEGGNVSLREQPLTTYPVGMHTVMLTAVDEAGNENSCTFRVTVLSNGNREGTLAAGPDVTGQAASGNSNGLGVGGTAGMIVGLILLLALVVISLVRRNQQRYVYAME
jgi:hypothetical protein